MAQNSVNKKGAGDAHAAVGSVITHDDKRIQQVLEIEKQAQAQRETAEHEAKQLPVQAEQEAQAMIEKARAAAQAEARQMIENAQAQEECERILAKAEDENRRTEALAKNHLEQAARYVLDRVAGRE
ncbi:MAG: hypothetical protein M1434_11765 [Chloroflexi bacterium]|nr:hypothetical protein [Chloroflexota bacterium]MCL5275400.1 hypothetical protein [Chloroflexota bacterium]